MDQELEYLWYVITAAVNCVPAGFHVCVISVFAFVYIGRADAKGPQESVPLTVFSVSISPSDFGAQWHR